MGLIEKKFHLFPLYSTIATLARYHPHLKKQEEKYKREKEKIVKEKEKQGQKRKEQTGDK